MITCAVENELPTPDLAQLIPDPELKDGRVVVPGKPDGLRETLIRSIHDAQWAGHPGQTKTFLLLAR